MDACYKQVIAQVGQQKHEWEEFDVTIVSHGWKDGANRPLILWLSHYLAEPFKKVSTQLVM